MFEEQKVYEELQVAPTPAMEGVAVSMGQAIRDPGLVVPRRRWPSPSGKIYDLESAVEWLARACAIVAAREKPESRWRPIDGAGLIAAQPADENPDDQDEGETGPEETSA
jgi:hypothetical protein